MSDHTNADIIRPVVGVGLFLLVSAVVWLPGPGMGLGEFSAVPQGHSSRAVALDEADSTPHRAQAMVGEASPGVSLEPGAVLVEDPAHWVDAKPQEAPRSERLVRFVAQSAAEEMWGACAPAPRVSLGMAAQIGR